MNVNYIKRLVCTSLAMVYALIFNTSLKTVSYASYKVVNVDSNTSESTVKEQDKLSLWNKYKNGIVGIGTIGTAGIIASCLAVMTRNNNKNEAVELINNDDTKNINNEIKKNKRKKVCFLGNEDYSKIALSNNFSEELYSSYERTVSQANLLSQNLINLKVPEEEINGKEEKVAMMSISSNKEYLNLYPEFLKGSDVNVLVYDLETTEVRDIKPWLDTIKEEDEASRKVMAVGTYYGCEVKPEMEENELQKACEERGLELQKPVYRIDKYNIKDNEEFKNFKEDIIKELEKVGDD